MPLNRCECDFTGEQIAKLKQIRQLARELEELGMSGKAHFIIALLGHFSETVYDPWYIVEKLNLLFDDCQFKVLWK